MVKTRLAKSVGDDRAIQIYRRLLAYTQSVTERAGAAKQVWFSDYIPEENEWDAPGIEFRLQRGEGLGERMLHAFRSGFEEGFRNIILIGSDCAQLSVDILDDGFRALREHDIVLGPSRDGGYYLIGLNKPRPTLFKEIPWSTTEVFEKTEARIRENGWSLVLLPTLNDVDTVEDWRRVEDNFRENRGDRA